MPANTQDIYEKILDKNEYLPTWSDKASLISLMQSYDDTK